MTTPIANLDTAQFFASHMASAQRCGLDAQAGVNALLDLLSSSGNGMDDRAQTHGGCEVAGQNLPFRSNTGGIEI